MLKDLAQHFAQRAWTWNLKRGGTRVPTEEDFQDALDYAAQVLYDEPVGTMLEVGRLIIVKRTLGHDVYAFFGPYQ